MGTKIHGLLMFDCRRRNWKEGRWEQRLNTCCIHAALVFFERYCGGAAAEQLLSAAKESSSCANSCTWTKLVLWKGLAGDGGVGQGKEQQHRVKSCPDYRQRCLFSRKLGFQSRCTFVGEKWEGRISYSYLHPCILVFYWKCVWLLQLWKI